MSAQHATGGQVSGGNPLAGFGIPADEPTTKTDYEQWRAAPKQGTPLGRIVLGVFLGLLAWSLFCAVVAGILLVTVLNQASDSSSYFPAPGPTATTSASGLSSECMAAIDAEADAAAVDAPVACYGDDMQAVNDYIAVQ